MLYNPCKVGLISREEALHNADSRNNLGLRIKLSKGAPIDSQTMHVKDGKFVP